MADAVLSSLPVPAKKPPDQTKIEITFEIIKEELSSGTFKCLQAGVLSKYCSKLQLKTSGTKQELIERLSPLQESSLYEKRVNRLKTEFKFKTFLPRENIPPPSARWVFDKNLFPRIGQEEISHYQAAKRQGKKGQYRKAQRMFLSGRMKSIKVLKTEAEVFIRARVLKSFTTEVARPVTVRFVKNIPKGAYCECAVGNSGLCCHAILVLLQLENFTKTNKLLLAPTCTQRLQTWHRPSKKGSSAKVSAASHISLKYLRNARSARRAATARSKKKVQKQPETDVSVAKSDWLIRDVAGIEARVSEKLEAMDKDVSNHFLTTLTKYKIKSGLYLHLSYKNAHLNKCIHEEHDYSKLSWGYDKSVLGPRFPEDNLKDVWHSVLNPELNYIDNQPNETSQTNKILTSSVFSNEKTKQLKHMLDESNSDCIEVKMPKLEEVKVCASNYTSVNQGTKEWLATRVGKITASKLPSLLGFNGHKEFDDAWFCIHNKLDESVFRPKRFKNFERGKMFEKDARLQFCKMSGTPVSSCGFFEHPEDRKYGASPDGIAECFLLEVKTRAEGSTEPLEKVSGSHLLQANFQMSCTEGEIVFLQSYLPEKGVSNVFYIARNDLLINCSKEITDHLLNSTIFEGWHYDEHFLLRKLGEQLLGGPATFEKLRHFRSWVNLLAKDVKKIKFM